ncbi:MAG TPA: hypothetical protein DG577_02060 [Firmicutes bacterium]|nr:hypothetical protein [Bacillota bacterium]HCX78174.1 hypothetical protein [Bacillota bacterium]
MGKVFVTRQLPAGGVDSLAAMHQVDINPHDRPLTRQRFLADPAEDGEYGRRQHICSLGWGTTS